MLKTAYGVGYIPGSVFFDNFQNTSDVTCTIKGSIITIKHKLNTSTTIRNDHAEVVTITAAMVAPSGGSVSGNIGSNTEVAVGPPPSGGSYSKQFIIKIFRKIPKIIVKASGGTAVFSWENASGNVLTASCDSGKTYISPDSYAEIYNFRFNNGAQYVTQLNLPYFVNNKYDNPLNSCTALTVMSFIAGETTKRFSMYNTKLKYYNAECLDFSKAVVNTNWNNLDFAPPYTAVDAYIKNFDLTNATDLYRTFYNYGTTGNGVVNYVDPISENNGLYYTEQDRINFNKQYLNLNWNVPQGKLKTMFQTFYGMPLVNTISLGSNFFYDGVTQMNGTFQSCPNLMQITFDNSTINYQNLTSMNYTFYNNPVLRSIRNIHLNVNTCPLNTAFRYCPKLTTITGRILNIKEDVNFAESPLDYTTCMLFANNLYNYKSAGQTGKTIVIKKSSSLTTTQVNTIKNTVVNKGWTMQWL